MTNYRSAGDEVVKGVIVYTRLRQGAWSVVSSNEEDGTLVVEDAEGGVMVLRSIEGSEQTASGPFIYEADE